jgi:predicted negative regulator of RcsB-dependent stress response
MERMQMVAVIKKYWFLLLVILFLALAAVFAWVVWNANAADKIPTRGVFI